ncbi:MAG TPA: phage major capsid protein [Bryobacteraceae bacterium]|nr:phage major capsid protein [Bryobacteraceae bacterium]HPT28793.1 phage major capsid protein [Bryobacteraceae bacterium]
MSNLEQNLSVLNSELREFIAKRETEAAQVKSAIATLQSRIEEMDKKNCAGGGFPRSGEDAARMVTKAITDGLSHFEQNGRYRTEIKSPLVFERKGFTSTGLVNPEAYSEIGTAGGWNYGGIRGLFRVVPIGTGSAFLVKETDSSGWNASPQTESSDKNESTCVLSASTLSVQTVAHWCRATKQSLADVEGLGEFVRGRLLWGLAQEVDQQIYSGDGTGTNLTGLITSAVPFDNSLLSPSAGWELCDLIGAGAAQVREAGYSADFVLLNPRDAFRLRFVKDSTGQYLALPALPKVVESTAVTETTFVVGDSRGAVIRLRQEATIDLSESHSDFFVKNMVALRAELRLLLQVIAPNAFVYGSSTATSPA